MAILHSLPLRNRRASHVLAVMIIPPRLATIAPAGFRCRLPPSGTPSPPRPSCALRRGRANQEGHRRDGRREGHGHVRPGRPREPPRGEAAEEEGEVARASRRRPARARRARGRGRVRREEGPAGHRPGQGARRFPPEREPQPRGRPSATAPKRAPSIATPPRAAPARGLAILFFFRRRAPFLFFTPSSLIIFDGLAPELPSPPLP